MNEPKETFLIRAAAHSLADKDLAPSCRFRNGVTNEDVAAIFYLMEAEGVRFARALTGHWIPRDQPSPRVAHVLRQVDPSPAIREMVRTGLARMWADRDGRHFITPARVHLRGADRSDLTACRDGVEGMKEGRVRTVTDLTLVDCLECESAVANGGPRAL